MSTVFISILNQKGGAGKTTIATNLAYRFHQMKIKTLLIDADPQGSARDWNEANSEKLIPVVAMDRDTLPTDIRAIDPSYRIVIIDGAPRVSKLSASAVKVSSMVLIPVQPSPYDVWACAELVDMVKTRQELTDGKPKAAFIVSRAIKNTNLSHDVNAAISEYGLPVLNSRTTQRVSYPGSAASGKTVFETVDNTAQIEISQIADEILGIVHAES